jgi:ferredoxin
VTTDRPAWRIEVDGTACDGHGICMLCCPSRIGLDEWGYAIVSDEPITNDHILAQARRAVRACPANALRVSALRTSPAGTIRSVRRDA